MMDRKDIQIETRRWIRPLLFYTRDLMAWELGLTRIPPHYLKRKLVLSYCRKYDLRIFCETGTYLGEMVRDVQKQFREIHSIELDQKLFRRAQFEFRRYPHIRMHQGNSGALLAQVAAGITDPCLFWLDAHFSGGITAKADKETPIEREIQAIRAHYVPGSVILIDDARCFTGEGDYPAYATVATLLKTVDPNFEVGVEHDVICAHNPHLARRKTNIR